MEIKRMQGTNGSKSWFINNKQDWQILNQINKMRESRIELIKLECKKGDTENHVKEIRAYVKSKLENLKKKVLIDISYPKKIKRI